MFAVLVAAATAQVQVVPFSYSHPAYSFGYGVEDPITGDSKSQVESRVGGVVRGQYQLNDSDGTRRVVDYAADDLNGFNAVVRKTPQVATAAVVAATPVVASAPAVVARPVAYASPYGYGYPYAYGAYGYPYVKYY